jgi:hypothetical protein
LLAAYKRFPKAFLPPLRGVEKSASHDTASAAAFVAHSRQHQMIKVWITRPACAFQWSRTNMTKSAKEFLDQWVSQHITPLSHDEDNTEARGSARICLADAERYGISYNELRDAAGCDLVRFMAGEIRKAVNEEVGR